MHKLLLKIVYIIITFNGMAEANDAVDSTSIGALGSYGKDLNNRDQKLEGYSASTNITLPLAKTENMGLNIHGQASRTKYSISNLELINKNWVAEVELFLRDPEVGGIIAGYRHLHWDTDFYIKSGFMSGKIDSMEDHLNFQTLKGEYYFDKITLAARYSHSDTPERGISVRWYPTDKQVLSATANNMSTRYSGNIYNITAEIQPEYFNDKLKVNLSHMRHENLARRNSIGASYHFSTSPGYNTTPAIGFTYSKKRYESIVSATDEGELLMLNFGFMFDNRISLKDRDRKYLFNSN
jgi:hypothetical protein